MSSPAVSVEQIDQKLQYHQREIEKLKTLRASILDFASKNGSQRVAQKPAAAAPKPQPKLVPRGTGLRAEVVGIMPSLPAQFTGEKVVQQLQAKHFNFEGRDPKAAVRDCLYALSKEAKGIRVREQGNAGKPTLYEKTS